MTNGDWFPGRLRELREQKGMSREELASQAGVSVRGLIKWELGEREPGWSNVLALAAALGVTTEAFHQPPAQREPAKPGRPAAKKAEEQPSGEKRKRGRPRKGEA
jgi:transcriptional regulator with XRE-family HTH domain